MRGEELTEAPLAGDRVPGSSIDAAACRPAPPAASRYAPSASRGRFTAAAVSTAAADDDDADDDDTV